MRLGTTVTLAGIGFTALGLALTTSLGGCSSKSSDTGNSGGTGTVWPAKPSAPATTSTAEHNYAIHTLLLGDADRGGAVNPGAWKTYGYNLDGKISTKDSTDVCTLASGASKAIQIDGTGGIDNSFGENILPIIITTAGSDATKKINDSINTGSFTVMIDTIGLSDDAAQTATGITGHLFAAGSFAQAPNAAGSQPKWTTADNWPVSPDFVTGGNVASPKITFADSYIVAGTYVNGSPTDVQLSLGLAGVTLKISIHHAIMTFEHKGSQAANGTIAGVIKTDELIAGLKGVAGSISTSLCTGSAFDSIAQQIKQASDIMSDGSNNAGSACDAISIGIGFTADEIGKPQAVGAEVTGVDKCAQSNTDGGTGDDGGTPVDSSTPVDSAAPADAAHE